MTAGGRLKRPATLGIVFATKRSILSGRVKMRESWRAGLFGLALVLCPASSRAAGDEFLRHLQAAGDAAQQGRFASAKGEYQAAIAIDPSRPQAWYELGLLYGRMSEFDNAERAFRQALRLDPDSARAHCRLGQTLVADPRTRQDWTGAVAEFREALRLQPVYPEAESFLGLGLNNLGETEKAIAVLRHALQGDPDLASAHLNLAIALETSGRLDEAAEEYQAALRAKPNAADTAASLGSLFSRMGQTEAAKREFRKALSLNPDLISAHYGLARVWKSESNAAQAAVEMDEVRDLEQREPNRVQALHLSNQSLQLAGKGDLAGAAVLLRRSLLLKPDYGVARYNLGLVLADAGDFRAARDELVKAVSLLPTEAKAWFDLGRVLEKTGDRQKALEAISWAAWLAPTNPAFAAEAQTLRPPGASAATEAQAPGVGATSDTAGAHIAFAADLRSGGDLPGAVGELLRALALEPDSLVARRALVQIYVARSDWDHARLEDEKILSVAGENEETYLSLGRIGMAEGHPAEAAAQFRLALRIRPQSSAAATGLRAALRASPQRGPVTR